MGSALGIDSQPANSAKKKRRQASFARCVQLRRQVSQPQLPDFAQQTRPLRPGMGWRTIFRILDELRLPNRKRCSRLLVLPQPPTLA